MKTGPNISSFFTIVIIISMHLLFDIIFYHILVVAVFTSSQLKPINVNSVFLSSVGSIIKLRMMNNFFYLSLENSSSFHIFSSSFYDVNANGDYGDGDDG